MGPPGRGRLRATARHHQRGVGGDPAAAGGGEELRRANEILKEASASSRPSWTGHFNAREVHRRAQGGVRGRADLPRAHPALLADRTEHLLRGEVPAGLGRILTQDPPAEPPARGPAGLARPAGGATELAGGPWTLQKRPFGSGPWPAPAPRVVIGSPSGICARVCQLARRIAGASRVVRPGK